MPAVRFSEVCVLSIPGHNLVPLSVGALDSFVPFLLFGPFFLSQTIVSVRARMGADLAKVFSNR